MDQRKYPKLQDIRDIRNESVGHPTKKKQSKGMHSYHYISGITLTLDEFELLTYFHDSEFETKNISVKECITSQEKYLKGILSSVIDALKKEEREHKEKFMGEKLANCFPSDIQYHVGKIYEAANLDHPTRRTMAMVTVELLQKSIDKFKNSLAKRGVELDTYDSIRYEYEYTKYPLEKLCVHFKCLKAGTPSTMTQSDVRVYNDSLEQHIKELKSMAESIDEEYTDLDDE